MELKEIALGVFVFVVLLVNISNFIENIKELFDINYTFMDVSINVLELLIYLSASVLGMIALYTLLLH